MLSARPLVSRVVANVCGGNSKAIVSVVRSYRTSPDEVEYLPYERKKFVRRYGMVQRHHQQGLLPRLDRNEGVLPTIPDRCFKPDPWHKREARFGENDYIDILGDGDTHPASLLKHVPWWLRGWRGTEFKMLQRKANVMSSMKNSRPEAWKNLQKRIDWLYRFRNLKTKPPTKVPRYKVM